LPLTPATRLGVYEITAQIGVGGMGEVYRATDTNLKRSVAIKVLPASVAGDADRLARFQREAEVLAALNHPNIGAIYGLEKTPDFTALVMELVEGDDLSERIARGAIPLDEALPIAQQIAEALEAAHEQGIIHRDLKPANIKLRSDGTVKVLDFGLAKAMDVGSSGPGGLSVSPTLSIHATQAGIILGTAAYMSPEQARGKTVDKRTDIWAFGAVLYEMLVGARPFDGEDATEVIAAVVKTPPNWSALPADVPRPIVTLIQRCLEKDRKTRVGDIAAARFLLADYSTLGISTSAPAQAGPAPRSAAARALPWAMTGTAVAAGLLVLALWAPWRAEKPADRPLVRLDVDLGTDVSLPAPGSGGSSVVISPDGARLVYASGTPVKLFTRRLDQPKVTELPGTQSATAPFFSPDGQWVGFSSGRKVNKISVEGGAAVPLADTATFAGAFWAEDGSIFVSDAFGKGLLRIPAGGGAPETIAGLGMGENAFALPQILPGGKAVLFSAVTSLDVDQNTIEVLTLADRHRKIVARGGQSPRYLATSSRVGHLVYVNKATLFAIPFDLARLETRGTAVPVVDDVAHQAQLNIGEFDVSRTGTLVYRRDSGTASGMMTLRWVDATGKSELLLARPGHYQSPSLSPDGKRVALLVAVGGSVDVWVYDPLRDAMTRLTFGGKFYGNPTWSEDGHYVVFSSPGNGILQARADGARQPQALTHSQSNQHPSSFAPDGKRLAYFEVARAPQIWTVPLKEEGGQLKAGKPEEFLKSSFVDTSPSFSPDGRWLAYQSNESGQAEVYVRAFSPPSSGHGGKWQISNSGGTEPRWSRSGHDLVYRSGDQILAASYAATGDTLASEKPRVWIAKLGGTQWDLAPDGKRVVVLTPVESVEAPKPAHEVVFLQNFFDELRRRVPPSK
jgi:Tol biopolymer transport system component